MIFHKGQAYTDQLRVLPENLLYLNLIADKPSHSQQYEQAVTFLPAQTDLPKSVN